MMTKVLFVCGKARMRSPAAADIAASWADVIAVMEKRQKDKLYSQYGKLLAQKKVAVLGVPDKYHYMEPALVEVLEPKLRYLLRL